MIEHLIFAAEVVVAAATGAAIVQVAQRIYLIRYGVAAWPAVPAGAFGAVAAAAAVLVTQHAGERYAASMAVLVAVTLSIAVLTDLRATKIPTELIAVSTAGAAGLFVIGGDVAAAAAAICVAGILYCAYALMSAAGGIGMGDVRVFAWLAFALGFFGAAGLGLALGIVAGSFALNALVRICGAVTTGAATRRRIAHIPFVVATLAVALPVAT